MLHPPAPILTFDPRPSRPRAAQEGKTALQGGNLTSRVEAGIQRGKSEDITGLSSDIHLSNHTRDIGAHIIRGEFLCGLPKRPAQLLKMILYNLNDVLAE